MDYKEAIRLLHPDTTRDALAEIEYYGGFKGKEKCIKAIEEACLLACEAMEIVKDKLKVGEWIPFTEEKPEEGQNVHVSLKDGTVSEGLYTKKYGFNLREGIICSNGVWINIREINAWMPKMKLRPYVENSQRL